MSALLQTIIGAVAAVVGGFVGAWWQTRRADDVARRIRREERQEQALLHLFSKASDVAAQLPGIARTAGSAPDTGQYETARQTARGLRQLWDTELSAVIPDQAISSAMLAFAMSFHELLPAGPDAMARYTQEGPADFVRDLLQLAGMAEDLKEKARSAMDARLLSGNPPR